jgi:hypothetical protein
MGETSYRIVRSEKVTYTDIEASTTKSIGASQVYLWASTDCFVTIDEAASESANTCLPLTGKIPWVLDVSPGAVIHVVRQSENGWLRVVQMAKRGPL